ncbi:MAG TPA: ATP-binding protein [Polyangia bacterium]
MFARVLSDDLRAAAGRMPVVTLTGPRQSGKTFLARATFPDHAYVSLEDPDERSLATADPRGFLSRFARQPAILDEVQRCPDLLSHLQGMVDADSRPGRFILTGSQNLLLLNKVSQTLAGRTALLRLLPLSLSELFARSPIVPTSLDSPAEGGLDTPAVAIWHAIWAGFYPRIHDRKLPPQTWLADYRRTYVDRDLRDILRVTDLPSFDAFLCLAAARTAQELNLSDLASDAGISQPTARAWLHALEVASLVTVLQPHHKSFRKRLRKRPRLHFLDSGLVCHLLGIQSPDMLSRHPLRGALFESFVVAELTKAFVHRGRDAPLYFWRDSTGHEIDIVMDLGDRLVPIEVKSGQTVASDAADNLRWWTKLAHSDRGVLIHGGTTAHSLHGFAIRPWFIA